MLNRERLARQEILTLRRTHLVLFSMLLLLFSHMSTEYSVYFEERERERESESGCLRLCGMCLITI